MEKRFLTKWSDNSGNEYQYKDIGAREEIENINVEMAKKLNCISIKNSIISRNDWISLESFSEAELSTDEAGILAAGYNLRAILDMNAYRDYVKKAVSVQVILNPVDAASGNIASFIRFSDVSGDLYFYARKLPKEDTSIPVIEVFY